jgi:hypothetical protein
MRAFITGVLALTVLVTCTTGAAIEAEAANAVPTTVAAGTAAVGVFA